MRSRPLRHWPRLRLPPEAELLLPLLLWVLARLPDPARLGQGTTMTVKVLAASTSGQVITTTDAQGRTVTLTYTPDANAVSQLVLETTSLANGQRSTITSFAVVGGAATITSQLPRPTPASTTGTPGLQSGLAA